MVSNHLPHMVECGNLRDFESVNFLQVLLKLGFSDVLAVVADAHRHNILLQWFISAVESEAVIDKLFDLLWLGLQCKVLSLSVFGLEFIPISHKV